MHKINHHTLAALAVFCAANTLSPVTMADDTDIFITEYDATGDTAYQPNVLFIFDTSGSMGSKILTTITYDPNETYGSSDNADIYVYTSDLKTNVAKIESSQNSCKAIPDKIAANTANPLWFGQAAYWKPDQVTLTPSGTPTFSDTFSSVSYSNNNGSSNWAGSWSESSDDGKANDGDIRITSNQLRIGNSSKKITRAADLSGYSSASLSFTYTSEKYTRSNETISLQINSSGSWVTLQTFNGASGTFTVDINSHLSANTQIRFSTSSNVDDDDLFFVDNFSIFTSSTVDASTGGSWSSLCSSGSTCYFNDTRTVDCAEDQGVHGQTDGSTAVWSTNEGDTPYSTEQSQAFSWSGVADYYYVSGNYHDYLQAGTTEYRPKTDIMKEEAKALIDVFDGINLGIMRFNGSAGGYVVHHFSDSTLAAEKTAMKTVIDGLNADGNTPLAESLWEAGRYYRSETYDYGLPGVTAAPTAFNGKNYISPIQNSCQKSYIVLLTDGQPVSDNGRDSAISTAAKTTCTHTDNATTSDKTCLDDYAGYLNTTDNSSVTDTQIVKTYTIGFAIDMALLKDTAQKGGGSYYTAGNSTELKDAFTQIIAEILETNTTFTAPAVTVNSYNNLQHRNELYYAMFKPQAKSRWPGNIKRYQINSDGTITDANNNSAISETTGYFETNAQSWWSASADGDQVESGGFAAELNTDRVAYVYTGTAAPDDTALNTAEHLLSTTNEAITNLLMGLDSTTSDSVRNNLIQWALGIDVNGDDPADNYHNFVADPLHTKPVVITYGGTEDAPDDTVYGMTNMGFLHAIDTDDGTEIFSWIPKELLPNLNKYYTDSAAIGKTYGLDGHLTVWRQESNDADVTIESAEGDHVYLYLGMRRGGNNYYALDVTSRTDPKLMWQINGGSGDFAALGQTWSKPELATIPWGCNSDGKECSAKKVLIFAGGYDTKHDTATAPTTGDTGNAVFIVDALSGALLWSAGKATSHDLTLDDMENSIPSDVTVGDTNADGNIDFLFAVDILGHLWRFDINQKTQSASDLATGGMIADLSGSATTDFRRFYNSPDVAIFSSRGSAPFLSVAFGSGYRENPKNEAIQDRFYTLFYKDVFAAPTDENGDIAYTALTDSDLLNATDTVANKSVNAPDGYYKNMSASGEKILSNSITFAGKTFFTSYLPQSTGSLCGVNIGGSRLYGLDLLTGEGIFTDGAEYMELQHGGIASDPAIIYTGDNTDGNSTTKPILCVGTECFADILDAGEILKKTYWREQ